MSDRLIDAIIFDMDGTLIDSNDLHANAWADAFAHYGVKLDFELVRSQIGKGGDLLVPDLVGAKEMLSFGDEIEDHRKKLFREHYRDDVRPFDGIRESFETLRELSIRIVIASSSNAEDLEFYLDRAGIADLVDEFTSADDVESSKPAPDVFEAALGKLGTARERTLVVGDTPYDILAAHRSALPIVAVRCGGFPEDALQKAELVLDDVPHLVRSLEEVEAMMSQLTGEND